MKSSLLQEISSYWEILFSPFKWISQYLDDVIFWYGSCIMDQFERILNFDMYNKTQIDTWWDGREIALVDSNELSTFLSYFPVIIGLTYDFSLFRQQSDDVSIILFELSLSHFMSVNRHNFLSSVSSHQKYCVVTDTNSFLPEEGITFFLSVWILEKRYSIRLSSYQKELFSFVWWREWAVFTKKK